MQRYSTNPADHRRLYSLKRMRQALERSITARTLDEQERAARWAAAWSVVIVSSSSFGRPAVSPKASDLECQCTVKR
jgi:hypothetical protein